MGGKEGGGGTGTTRDGLLTPLVAIVAGFPSYTSVWGEGSQQTIDQGPVKPIGVTVTPDSINCQHKGNGTTLLPSTGQTSHLADGWEI